MEQQIATVLGSVIVAGILWLAKNSSDSSKAITRIETILTGEDGVTSQVRQLRKRSHELGTDIQKLYHTADRHEQRIEALEER
jgi:outer membrane murein-binding lipoprotein Lpp